MTNGDRIRQMTDKELAEFLNAIVIRCQDGSGCTGCPLMDGCAYDAEWQERWLKQEVQNAEH